MYDCTLKADYNRCRFLRKHGDEYQCSNQEPGCGFRVDVPDAEAESVAASSYVRKPRWYEEFYPDTRPVKSDP